MKHIFLAFIIASIFPFGFLQSSIQSCRSDRSNKNKKIIIIGASSGMGRATAIELSKRFDHSCTFGLCARRKEKLEELSNEISQKCFVQSLDVSRPEEAQTRLQNLIELMGGIDIALLTASACYETGDLSLVDKQRLIDVDVRGFVTIAHTLTTFFEKQGHGHLAAISSINRERGDAKCKTYCGVKAFQSKYLEGQRNHYIQNNIPIHVTEIIPGWVDVEHATFSGKEGTYWVIDAKTAAYHIANAIEEKKKEAYIEPRQYLISWLLHITPDYIYNKLGGF